jgi:endogenous inhibitor of DNA gyrase (YacG/DUF329 family)
MIVEGQKAKVTWGNRNASYFIGLGYEKLNVRDEFEIPMEHLTSGSRAVINLICDFCGEHFTNKFSVISKSKNHFCKKKCQDQFLVGKPSWNAKKVIVNCGQCAKKIDRSEYETKNHKNLFCSRKCANNFMVGKGKIRSERFTLQCDYCTKEIIRTQSEIDRSKNHFCDSKCASAYLKGKELVERQKRVETKCNYCDELIHRIPSRVSSFENQYCNQECYVKWMNENGIHKSIGENLKKGSFVNCTTCNEKIYKKKVHFSKSKTNKFYCSKVCLNVDKRTWSLPQNTKQPDRHIRVKCYNCEKEKTMIKSAFDKNKYFFCSYDCYHKRRIEITNFKQTGTSIHIKVNNYLSEIEKENKNEIQFGYYSADIFLPRENLIIEIMGDYWHSNPLKYKNVNDLNNIQRKNIKKDKLKNKLILNNFKVPILYLWERDINENFNVCKKLIQYFIENNGDIVDFHSYNYFTDNQVLYVDKNLIDPYFNL